MDPYRVTSESWDRLAQAYEDKFMDLDLYNDSYDLICHQLPESARVLEVGCGPGNISRYLLSKRPDLQIMGTDVSHQMVLAAQKNNPGARFEVLDARNLDLLDQQFDAIVCGFCIPYLSATDYLKLVNDCGQLLLPHGLLYISGIEGNYADSGYEKNSEGTLATYVYYHSADFLLGALQEYSEPTVIRKQYEKSDGTLSVHLIILANKQIDSRPKSF